MLTPPRSTAPFWSAAPDRILPVCPGWMPTPVACLLNKPEMTFKRGRREDKGSRLLLNCISAPEPFAHQFLGLMPLPMNRAANRRGGEEAAAPEGDSLPQTGIDSSHGRAIVTPTPLSSVRRLILCDCGFVIAVTRSVQLGVVLLCECRILQETLHELAELCHTGRRRPFLFDTFSPPSVVRLRKRWDQRYQNHPRSFARRSDDNRVPHPPREKEAAG